jgi:hypothetical protein
MKTTNRTRSLSWRRRAGRSPRTAPRPWALTPKRAAGDGFRALVGPLVLVSALAPTAPDAAPATCTRPAQPPNPSSAGNQLQSVAVVSACNAWAVGYYDKGAVPQTLIVHWNGVKWRQVPSPDPGGAAHANILSGVAATSSRDAWAVGIFNNGTAGQTMILRWNGIRWRQAPSPDPSGSSSFNQLNAVAATSARNAWAVGFDKAGTLIEQWNGSKWRHVPSPNIGVFDELEAVGATSSASAWAVGDYIKGTAVLSLIEHWNGTRWRRVTSPNPGGAAGGTHLVGVGISSVRSAWAVGYYNNGSGFRTLIVRWNGTRWRQVTSPNPGGADHTNLLNAVTVSQSGKAWAVGYYAGRLANQTLVLNWNGTRWRRLPSSNPGGSAEANYLNGVAATPTGCAWAVGDYFTGTVLKTLAIRC